MKIKYLISFILSLNVNILIAQSDTIKNKYIKVFSNVFYSKYSNDYNDSFLPEYSIQSSEHIDFSYGYLSISLEKELKNKNSFELEILPFRVNYSEVKYLYYSNLKGNNQFYFGGKIFVFETGLRYQYNYNFLKNSNSKLKLYLGISPNLFYIYRKIMPIVRVFYTKTQNQVGLGFSLIPSIAYKLTEKITIDFNIPIRFDEIGFKRNNIDNPMLSKSLQNNDKYYNEWVPQKFYLRFGLKIKI